MINIPKNYKEGDILVVKNGRLEAVDPKSIFNVDTEIAELKNEILILTQLIKDNDNRNKDFINKLKEAYKWK